MLSGKNMELVVSAQLSNATLWKWARATSLSVAACIFRKGMGLVL